MRYIGLGVTTGLCVIATVFLVLPPDRLGTYARWLRLMVTQSLQEMARTPGKPAVPVL